VKINWTLRRPWYEPGTDIGQYPLRWPNDVSGTFEGSTSQVLAAFRRLALGLHLAISLGSAVAVGLLTAFDGKRVVGHIAGDHRARPDIGARAESHRRHQRRIRTDECA